MVDRLNDIIKNDNPGWTQFQDLLIERQITAKTILLHEGETSTHVHFIKKGCLREWFNKDGKEITFQFFFEGQAVVYIQKSIDPLFRIN